MKRKDGRRGESSKKERVITRGDLLYPFSAILFLFSRSFVPLSIFVLLVVRYSSLTDSSVREVIGRDSGASFPVMRYIYRRNLEHHSAAINLLAALQGQCTSSGYIFNDRVVSTFFLHDRFGDFFFFFFGEQSRGKFRLELRSRDNQIYGKLEKLVKIHKNI